MGNQAVQAPKRYPTAEEVNLYEAEHGYRNEEAQRLAQKIPIYLTKEEARYAACCLRMTVPLTKADRDYAQAVWEKIQFCINQFS